MPTNQRSKHQVFATKRSRIRKHFTAYTIKSVVEVKSYIHVKLKSSENLKQLINHVLQHECLLLSENPIKSHTIFCELIIFETLAVDSEKKRCTPAYAIYQKLSGILTLK